MKKIFQHPVFIIYGLTAVVTLIIDGLLWLQSQHWWHH